jgi:polar amino acid transport system permease protein
MKAGGEAGRLCFPCVSDRHPSADQQLILLVKDSSLAYILGLSATGFELTKYGRDLSSTNANLTPLVVAGLCYLVITLPLTFLVQRLEARAKRGR